MWFMRSAGKKSLSPKESMGAHFSQFMYVHKIPTTAAAFSIGGASAKMAKMMAIDVVLPLLYGLVGLVYKVKGAPKLQLKPFFNAVVTWVCVLFASYVLVEYVFGRTVMGMSTVVVGEEQRKEMGRAREQAIRPMEHARAAVQAVVGFPAGGALYHAAPPPPFPLAKADALESDRKTSSIAPRVLTGARLEDTACDDALRGET
jgi:hypothetical protein